MDTGIHIQLSVIIVNWRSKDYALECIGTLINHPPECPYEIIVIDCASNDGIAKILSVKYPSVRVIESAENLGFARANNTASLSARGEFLLLLNPDTEVNPGSLNAMLNVIASQKDIGITGAKLLNSDRTIQTSCVQAFPCLANQLIDSEFCRQLFPNSPLWGNAMLHQPVEHPVDVDAVSGACLLIRKSLYQASGGLSEDYFMYSEDVEICYKARSAGYRVVYIPTALVVHHGGRSSRQQSRRQFANVMMVESRFRFFQKTRGFAYSYAYRLGMGLAAMLRLPLTALKYCGSVIASSDGHKSASHFKWAAILHWAIARTSALQAYAPPAILPRLLSGLRTSPIQIPRNPT
jgi:N-acetylglucosaminyl-diphospho-decaprenol L-rhamnosyltransferase